jgi:hypothetical protein
MRPSILFFVVITLAGISAAQDTSFAVGPQYLMTSGSPLFARPIATPTLSLGESHETFAAEISAVAEVAVNPVLQGQADLLPIYYGTPRVSIIEISEPESAARPLPASITDIGVTEITDLPSLRQRGIGVSLSEAASYWKTHKPAGSHTYTNRDIERLQHGS